MSILDILLELQSNDLAIDQLQYRRDNLPQRIELHSILEQLNNATEELASLMAKRAALVDKEDELQRRSVSLGDRIKVLETKLYSGEVAAPRELQAMAEEVASLRAHRSELDDETLVLMEEVDPLEAQIDAVRHRIAELSAVVAELEANIASEEKELDAQIAVHQASRNAQAITIPSDLLVRYENLRSRLGGEGVALLVNGSCSGCHLKLPSVELERIRKAPLDALITCEQCGRILIRRSASDL